MCYNTKHFRTHENLCDFIFKLVEFTGVLRSSNKIIEISYLMSLPKHVLKCIYGLIQKEN